MPTPTPAPPPPSPRGGLTWPARIGATLVLLGFATGMALLIQRNVSTGLRVFAAGSVAVTSMIAGGHLVSFDSFLKLEHLFKDLIKVENLDIGWDKASLDEIKNKLEELEQQIKSIRCPAQATARLVPIGSIDDFPTAEHQKPDGTPAGAYEIQRLASADLARAQCLVAVGGADVRPLRRKAAERYGTNQRLALKRAEWAAGQLVPLARRSESDPPLPVTLLAQSPQNETAGADPALLRHDRRVDLYACIGAIEPPPPDERGLEKVPR